MSAATGTVILERRDEVLHIRLNRPEKRNALDLETMTAVVAAIDGRAPGTRAIVLSGTGGFCAGADIGVYAAGDPARIELVTRRAAAMVEAIATVPVPVIAAVEGPALGGGFEVVLAADLVIAGRTASFGLPEIRLGLAPAWGGTQRLVAQIGIHRAKAMIFLAARMDSAQAAALGLVHEVVADGGAVERALELAGTLARAAAPALAAGKRLTSSAERALDYEGERSALLDLVRTPEAVELCAAFTSRSERGRVSGGVKR